MTSVPQLRFLADTVLKLVQENGAQLQGSFTVVEPGYTRIRPRPQ